MRTSFFWTVVILALTPLQSKSQEINDREIGDSEQKEVISILCDRYERAYIFPEKVKEIKEYLSKQVDAGNYGKLLSASAFAQQLDKDIQYITKDKHTGISFNPKMASEILSEKNESYYTPGLIEELRKSNFGFTEIKILPGNIGFMDLREFCPAKYAGNTAVAAMNFFANCNALIIDLRYNGGGDESMVQFLSSYFFDTADTTITFFTSYNRLYDTYFQSSTFPYVPGEKLYLTPVYILVSRSTFSAAEAFTYNMQVLKRATIVGENTGGGENPVEIQALMKDFVIFIPAWKILNSLSEQGTRWEGTGIKPDIACLADEALDFAHIEALQELLEKTTLEAERLKFQWAIDGVKVRQDPFVIDEKRLKSFAGMYGNYIISYEEGHLLCQRGDRTRMKMTPMNANTFLIEKTDNIRIRFNEVKGGITIAEILSDDGLIRKFPKEL